MTAIKGFGYGLEGRTADKQRASLNLDWGYGWSADCPGTGFGSPEQFVPMIFSKKDIAKRLATVKKELPATQATHLLGFNEPDLAGQAEMSVASALYHWPKLEDAGLRLGSPAAIKPNAKWLYQFMSGAEKKGLRVDFMTVHSYGWPNSESFLDKLQKMYDDFGRPIWVTEYAVADWDAKTTGKFKYKSAEVRAFMSETVAGMRDMPFVERFAWKTRAAGDLTMGTSALFHTDGTLTPTGELYATL